MNDLISVIMPVYKVEKYLAESIESVLNQDHQNLELILIDDVSPDHSGRFVMNMLPLIHVSKSYIKKMAVCLPQEIAV